MISKELIEELERRFPVVPPNLTWTDREVWFKAGQWSVVALLKRELERLTKESTNVLQRTKGPRDPTSGPSPDL